MKMKSIVFGLPILLVGFGAGVFASNAKTAMAVQSGEVKWTPAVPALGAKGPQISVVFGDPKKGPVGMLLKVPAGGKSGPHTHTSDYWGVVINGTVHDFPPGESASAKHLDKGSWWMEPGAEPHDNYCSDGTDCLSFVYFPNGFDLKPFAAESMMKK